jgi:hypothetical protein
MKSHDPHFESQGMSTKMYFKFVLMVTFSLMTLGIWTSYRKDHLQDGDESKGKKGKNNKSGRRSENKLLNWP